MAFGAADGELYDIGLSDAGYILDWERGNAYEVEAPDLTYEPSAVTEDIAENKLDRADWRSMRSAHHGAGQRRFDVPNASDPFKFLESKGVDVTEEGEVSLLPATSRILTLSNSGTAPQVSQSTAYHLFTAAGQPNLKALSSASDTSPSTVSTGTETSKETYDLAFDGKYLYIALGSDGVHRTDASSSSGSTQRDAFDATTGWSRTSGGADSAVLVVTGDKQEGAGSLALDVLGPGTGATTTWEKAFTADLSAATAVRFWLKSTATMTIRFEVDSSNYYSYAVSSTSGSWSEITIAKTDFTTTGSPTWATLTKLKLATANYVDMTTATAGSFTSTTSWTVVPYQVLIFYIRSQPSVTPPSGWTLIRRTNTASGQCIESYYNLSPGSTNVTFTMGASASGIVIGFGADTSDLTQLINNAPTGSVENESTSTTTSYAATSALTIGSRSIIFAAWEETGSGGTAVANLTGSDIGGPLGSIAMTTTYGGVSAIIADSNTTPTVTSSSQTFNGIQGFAFTFDDPTPARTQFDDLRSVTALSAATHWSDHDTRVVGAARNALYGAGISSGTIWRFFEVGATTTSTNLKTLPDGWVVTDIAGFNNFVYFSAYAGSQGRVYCYDGTTTFVAWEAPIGEQPLSLTSYLGQGVLIGCRFSITGGSTGHGSVYRAQVASDGSLSAVRVHKFGDHTADYGVYSGFTVGDLAYYGWSNPDASSTGLAVFMPRVDAESGQQRADYAGSLYAATQGLIRSTGLAFGKRYFTVDGSGVWIEQSTYLASGTLTSSDIDWNIDKLKLVLQGEVGCEPLTSTETLAVSYSTDDGTSYTDLATASGAATRVATGNIRATHRSIRLKATLTANAAATVTPVMKKLGVSAIYGVKPRYTHKLRIKAHDQLVLRNGVPHPDAGRPGLAARIETALRSLRDNQSIVTFNPPGFGYEGNAAVTVRVGDIKVVRYREQGIPAAVIELSLVELPS